MVGFVNQTEERKMKLEAVSQNPEAKCKYRGRVLATLRYLNGEYFCIYECERLSE